MAGTLVEHFSGHAEGKEKNRDHLQLQCAGADGDDVRVIAEDGDQVPGEEQREDGGNNQDGFTEHHGHPVC